VEANAAELWTGPLTEKIDVLGKRLSVKMPTGSIKEPRAHSIMGAAEPDEDESRVELKLDGKEVVFMATDLHSYSGADFKSSVEKYANSDEKNLYNISEVLKSDGGLSYILLKRKSNKLDPKNEDNFVEAAIVLNRDGTIQKLDVYVNQSSAKQWDEAISLAERIFKSSESGSTSANFKKRTMTIDDFLGISIAVPEKTSTSMQHGCDFKVFHCQLMKNLSEPQAGLGVYIGNHPAKSREPKSTTRKSTLAGQEVEWSKSKVDSKYLKSETILQLKEFPIYYLHIFASAQTDDELNQLEKIAETISIDKNSKANQPINKGFLLLMARKLAEAIEQFNLVLKNDSKNLQAIKGIAQVHFYLKDYQKTIDSYTQAIAIEAEPSLYMERAWSYLRLKNSEKALEDFGKAISIDSKNANAYYERAKVLKERREFQKSVDDYSKYLEFHPEVGDVRFERASVYRELGEFQKAVEDCTKAIQDRESEEFFEERALNYERLGKNDLAKKDRLKAKKLRDN